jgi:hypothetical protein
MSCKIEANRRPDARFGAKGHSLESWLGEGALDDLRFHGLAVIAHRPFVADFVRRRREYPDLVTAETAVAE